MLSCEKADYLTKLAQVRKVLRKLELTQYIYVYINHLIIDQDIMSLRHLTF